MTVGELIEELRKFPEHHVVQILHPDGDAEPAFGIDGESESSIADVRAAGKGEVVIDCTDESL